VRYKVAIGVCKALQYLHDEIPRPVIHMDVKASNILLSRDFQPQVPSYIHSISQKTIGGFFFGCYTFLQNFDPMKVERKTSNPRG